MADDSCPECGYTVQSDWNTCPLCSVSLGAGTAGEVTGDDNITVFDSEGDVSIKTGDSTRTTTESGNIHQGDVHQTNIQGADPQKVKKIENKLVEQDKQLVEQDKRIRDLGDQVKAILKTRGYSAESEFRY